MKNTRVFISGMWYKSRYILAFHCSLSYYHANINTKVLNPFLTL